MTTWCHFHAVVSFMRLEDFATHEAKMAKNEFLRQILLWAQKHRSQQLLDVGY